MLDKSPIPESLKETVVSPLVKDKLFGLPFGKRQEEVSKTPQNVKVDGTHLSKVINCHCH
jgi:hypothetical protein